VAADYDEHFTNTRLGRMLRQRVWRHLEEQFTAGQYLLDLACGTGEDALWLAKQGIHILALDGSPEMVRLATKKANSH
jgi:ubiquinone/menaquinone biosynthesis C-methylase UbiE